MRRLLSTVAVAALASTVLLAGCAPASRKTVTLKGSDTMVILGQRWAEEYAKADKTIQVQVTGGGSGVGIAALINKTADIAQSSRPLKPQEQADAERSHGRKVVKVAVALDGIAIYVNEKNPVGELTLEQIKSIFTGAKTNWKDFGGKDAPIILYGRENVSGTYEFMKERVLSGREYANTVQAMSGTAAVVNAVARDANAVGYGGIAYAQGVKIVKVKKDAAAAGAIPTRETVTSLAYPISRELYWFHMENPSKPVQDLVAWVLSAKGQAMVLEVGYFPVSAATR
jgi:phosphate transport system substrate-binding protein